jgi:hypothetical protein
MNTEQSQADCQYELTNQYTWYLLLTNKASLEIELVLIGKTRMKFRSASVQISYALVHLREIPRFLSTQGTRRLLAFNLTLI